MEPSDILDLRQKCHVLQSGKIKLQAALIQASDTLSDLKARGHIHSSCDELIKEVQTCLDTGNTFLAEIRDNLPIMQSHKVDADQASEFAPKVDAFSQKAMVHIDGLKHKQKLMKQYL